MPSRRDVLHTGLALSTGLAAQPASSHTEAHASPPGAPKPPAVIKPYTAACIQTPVRPTWSASGSFLPEALATNLGTITRTIERTAGESGARLLVFSEFGLQLPQSRLSEAQWNAGAISLDGPEIAQIAEAAHRANAWVIINPVEAIADFPGRYFLTGILISPTDGISLAYRKLYDLTSKTRPSDILEAWVDRFGSDSLFPVADTPLGRIALTIGVDTAWPEMVRSLVFNGAEVIATCLGSPKVSPSSPVQRRPDAPDARDPVLPVMARRVRACENIAYMLTANLGPSGPDPAPDTMQPSEIVDFHGNVLAAAPDGAARAITATLDIEALRTARCTPGPANSLVQLQTSLHAAGYAQARFDTPTSRTERGSPDHDAIQRAKIRELVARGILHAPATGLS